MENEILIALISKMVDERIADLPVVSGPRGPRGIAGQSGSDFVFSEHEETIRAWAKEFALKFGDLTDDQVQSLRGSRGRDGRNGSDGRSFRYEENREAIESAIRSSVADIRGELKLQFSDLTEEEISKLRGKNGRDGRPGKDFDFEENRGAITDSVRSTVTDERENLRLKFSDLDSEEIEQLRGSRGRDGRDGRDFIFDEHREFFDGLRLKFTDLTDAEKDALKLQFSHLTEDEKNSLKLKFTDLTDDDRLILRGARGSRGQRGPQGRDGEDGKSVRGIPGMPGVRGLTGRNGLDGLDGINGRAGADAPYITAIDIEQDRDEIIFIFEFSDGSRIRSDSVTIPAPTVVIGSGGGKGGGSMVQYDTRVDEPNSTTTYVGESIPGYATSDPVWRIKRLSVVGSETIIEFAKSKADFTNAWDDRASLMYG